MLDEVERLTKQSPEFARIAADWMPSAVASKNPRPARRLKWSTS
jgi:hypothetical protein